MNLSIIPFVSGEQMKSKEIHWAINNSMTQAGMMPASVPDLADYEIADVAVGPSEYSGETRLQVTFKPDDGVDADELAEAIEAEEYAPLEALEVTFTTGGPEGMKAYLRREDADERSTPQEDKS